MPSCIVRLRRDGATLSQSAHDVCVAVSETCQRVADPMAPGDCGVAYHYRHCHAADEFDHRVRALTAVSGADANVRVEADYETAICVLRDPKCRPITFRNPQAGRQMQIGSEELQEALLHLDVDPAARNANLLRPVIRTPMPQRTRCDLYGVWRIWRGASIIHHCRYSRVDGGEEVES